MTASQPTAEPFGTELILDLGGCELATITSAPYIAKFAAELCQLIGMRAYGQPTVERFGLAEEKTAGYARSVDRNEQHRRPLL